MAQQLPEKQKEKRKLFKEEALKNLMAQQEEERIKDERKARAARFALETKAKLQKAIQRKKLR